MIILCTACSKELDVCAELAGCDIYCEACPIPVPPCETCGTVECDGECCDCAFCIERRAGAQEAL
jgi:hypothetical protein